MKIEGSIAQKTRIVTGMYSFDRAFQNQKGEIGFPIGTATELYGPTFCGKSTIAYSLAGILATYLDTNIALADFEGLDPEFLQTVLESTGFDNILYYISEKTDEITLKSLLKHLNTKADIGILDSIGAISTISEAEGDLGEANMGRRAFLMAQFARRATKIFRTTDKVLFMVNHAYPVIGGRGTTTPGGEVKKYLSSIRIEVKRKFYKGKWEEYPDGSYIITGKVKKNRWGYKDREFELFILGGFGIHQGLTAMLDTIRLKLATKDKVIKIGDKSFGYLKDMCKEAREGNVEFFSPFIELLANVEKEDINETTEIEDIEEDESGDTSSNREDN